MAVAMGQWWRSDWGHTGGGEGDNSDDNNEGCDDSCASEEVTVAVAMGQGCDGSGAAAEFFIWTSNFH